MIAERGYVVENGRIALHAPARELLESPEVAECYLGIGSTPATAGAGEREAAARIRRLVWG